MLDKIKFYLGVPCDTWIIQHYCILLLNTVEVVLELTVRPRQALNPDPFAFVFRVLGSQACTTMLFLSIKLYILYPENHSKGSSRLEGLTKPGLRNHDLPCYIQSSEESGWSYSTGICHKKFDSL